jgi:RNA polymerase sigma-70 factor (ECF subfamily)
MPTPDRTRERWIAELLARYEGPLVHYSARILGDVERGRDVVQDAFLRLCAEDPRALDGRVAEWLFTVCRNRALDLREKERPMLEIACDEARESESPEPGPRARLESVESAHRLAALVDALPERERELIRLKFQHGLSYKEIANVTSLTVTNVGFLIHRGVKALRERIAREERRLEGRTT